MYTVLATMFSSSICWELKQERATDGDTLGTINAAGKRAWDKEKTQTQTSKRRQKGR